MINKNISKASLTSLLGLIDQTLEKRCKKEQRDFLHSLDLLEKKLILSKERITQLHK